MAETASTDIAEDGDRTIPGSRTSDGEGSQGDRRRFLIGLARAVGGAVIFSLPLLMTMEMWRLGFYMDRLRLALLLATSLPLLLGLSYVSGFEKTSGLLNDAVDALVACAIGFATSALGLTLLGVMNQGMSLDETVGKISLLALPGSIGALLAQSQFGSSNNTGDGQSGADGEPRGGAQKRGDGAQTPPRSDGASRSRDYAWELFLMAVGALFLGFNVAPTEEMMLIAYRTGPWLVLAIMVVSLLAMHGFVYAMQFRGQEDVPPGTPLWSVFVRFTIAGYLVAIAVSAYVLWIFGRLDGTGPMEALTIVVVLGFPAAIGAAAARLIL